MMRFSNLRNAVLAFMLAFTAACSTGGDTAPAGPGSENTTGDASVAACCTVNPSNSLVVDLSSPTGTALEQLAWWKCQRYFVERSNQDAKSELGWDEFQAQKFLAWQHHVACTVLASWFVAQTKLE